MLHTGKATLPKTGVVGGEVMVLRFIGVWRKFSAPPVRKGEETSGIAGRPPIEASSHASVDAVHQVD